MDCGRAGRNGESGRTTVAGECLCRSPARCGRIRSFRRTLRIPATQGGSYGSRQADPFACPRAPGPSRARDHTARVVRTCCAATAQVGSGRRCSRNAITLRLDARRGRWILYSLRCVYNISGRAFIVREAVCATAIASCLCGGRGTVAAGAASRFVLHTDA
jgi:hypothetical protein